VPSQSKPDDTRTVQLSIDRFEEGKGKTKIAILLTDDGTAFDVPGKILPAGASPGDVLTVTFRRDLRATRRVADRTRSVQDELKAADPGGDIKI
jgi:hypothetical protein